MDFVNNSSMDTGVPQVATEKRKGAETAPKMFRKGKVDLSHTFRIFFSFEKPDGMIQPRK